MSPSIREERVPTFEWRMLDGWLGIKNTIRCQTGVSVRLEGQDG